MKTICIMRDLLKAMANFEIAFEKEYQLSFNEAMVLCAIKESEKTITATNLSKGTGLTPSHTSKVLRVLEEKKMITRAFCMTDKRLMFFSLTEEGRQKSIEIAFEKVNIPTLLAPLFCE